jgi:hypothetical protein
VGGGRGEVVGRKGPWCGGREGVCIKGLIEGNKPMIRSEGFLKGGGDCGENSIDAIEQQRKDDQKSPF